MLKKMLFLSLIAIGLFANEVSVSTLELSKDGESKTSVVKMKKSKLIIISGIYNGEAKSITTENLESLKNKVQKISCHAFEDYINDGYKILVEYFYKNDVAVRVVIDNCK